MHKCPHLWSLKARSRTWTMLSMGQVEVLGDGVCATSMTVRSFCVPMFVGLPDRALAQDHLEGLRHVLHIQV